MVKVNKLDSRTVQGTLLGVDDRRAGYFVWVESWRRLTTFKFKDCYFTTPYKYNGIKRISGIYKQGPSL